MGVTRSPCPRRISRGFSFDLVVPRGAPGRNMWCQTQNVSRSQNLRSRHEGFDIGAVNNLISTGYKSIPVDSKTLDPSPPVAKGLYFGI